MPLLLGLAAEVAAASPGWAMVGLPQTGTLAAEAAGLDLAGGMRIDHPGRHWAQVLATVLEAVPVVLVGPLGVIPDRVARRLSSVMRGSGSVLLAAGVWPGAEVRVEVLSGVWEGIGMDGGLLRCRRVQVRAVGRGAAARPRIAEMWLPGPEGQATPVEHATDVAHAGVEVPGVGGLRPVLRVVG